MKKLALIILATVAALLIIVWNGGWLDGIAQPGAIQAIVARAGAWGPCVFILLAMGLFAVFLLSPPVWAAAALWPLPLAFSYSFVAALLASVITYLAARRLGQDWAQDRVPASIQRWEERLRARPVSTIIALRVLLWANPLVDMFAAVSRVPTRTYLLASAVGLAPSTAFQIFLGVSGISLAGYVPWWGWVLAGAALASGLAFRRLRARRALE